MKKVLIADDDNVNRYMLEALLKGFGFETVSAENGKEALDKAHQSPPDLIISDILMPVMDGYALCREWKSDDALKSIPLVFYTATYTESKDKGFALSLGADRFIIKPQEPDMLMRIINEVLEDGYQARQSAAKPLGEEMELFREYNEILFKKLEKKMLDLEAANQKLATLEERYRLSFEHVADVVYTIDADFNITSISPSMGKILGYNPQNFINQPVSKLDNILTPESYKQMISDVNSILNGGSISAINYQFIAKDGSIKHGEVSGSPIMRKGEIIGVISVIRDITDRKQTEMHLNESLVNLRKAVGTTIQVMVATVEVRDPYTAYHQVRSANIARAIATEMGFAHDRIEGIRIAGSVHDIGKLSIPAEILVKPTKLSDIEFSLIKEHCRSGYEILKKVQTSWPLAQIAHQHHERMNGSGYPNNLKGDEIILEARIMAVADVVEAMASHRPYRPALGINAALDEIEKYSGELYDAKVAEACVKIFREKGFQLDRA